MSHLAIQSEPTSTSHYKIISAAAAWIRVTEADLASCGVVTLRNGEEKDTTGEILRLLLFIARRVEELHTPRTPILAEWAQISRKKIWRGAAATDYTRPSDRVVSGTPKSKIADS
jgi:hypothetical protein